MVHLLPYRSLQQASQSERTRIVKPSLRNQPEEFERDNLVAISIIEKKLALYHHVFI